MEYQPIGTAPSLEPLGLLAHAAALTERMRLGTAVILAPLRIPVALAADLATVDRLSGGRLVAGLALGGDRTRYAAFGLSPEARVRRFEEGVRLLTLLWTESSVTFDGEFWQLHDVSVQPKPVQQPHPPLWFGGGSPAAVRRAARLADGWIGAGSSTAEAFRQSMSVLRDSLGDAGRDLASYSISKRVYVAVDDDRERARSRLREWFGVYYGAPDLADRVALAGPAEACVEGLVELVGAGADLLIVNPVFDEEQQAEVLAAEVLPRVTAAVR